MHIKIESSWKEQLANEFEKPYFKALTNFVMPNISNTNAFRLHRWCSMPLTYAPLIR